MKRESDSTQFEHLRDILLPILAQASVGRFDLDVPINISDDRNFNEILAGVQMLLEVIRQQQQEIVVAKNDAKTARRQATDMLSDVLNRSVSKN